MAGNLYGGKLYESMEKMIKPPRLSNICGADQNKLGHQLGSYGVAFHCVCLGSGNEAIIGVTSIVLDGRLLGADRGHILCGEDPGARSE